MMAEHNEILELAIHYALKGGYPTTMQLSKDKKRAVRKRASTLTVEDGEVFLKKNKRKARHKLYYI